MVGEPTTEQAKRIHKARYSSVPMVKLRGARYTLKGERMGILIL